MKTKKELYTLSNEDLSLLKKRQTEILKAFMQACETLNLKWYVFSGTMLGAVRHKGYIPWDDDLDTAMPIEDYVALLEKGQKVLGPHFFVQDYSTDPEYVRHFAKIRMNGTSYIEQGTEDLNINQGIFIDIFPLFGLPKSKIARWFFLFKFRIINKRICTHKSASFFIRFVTACSTFFLSRKYLKKKRMALMTKYCPSKTGFVSAGADLRMVYPIHCLTGYVDGQFEGLTVRLPVEYDYFLTATYGDYMTPPPPEKRCGHHYCLDFDPGDKTL